MAPELCGGVSGTDKYSSRIDVYSFGLPLGSIAGVTPWSHATFKFSFRFDRVQKGDRPPISDRMKADAPAGYFAMVKSCWHQEPKNRPPFRGCANVCFIVPVLVGGGIRYRVDIDDKEAEEEEEEKVSSSSSSSSLYNKRHATQVRRQTKTNKTCLAVRP